MRIGRIITYKDVDIHGKMKILSIITSLILLSMFALVYIFDVIVIVIKPNGVVPIPYRV